MRPDHHQEPEPLDAETDEAPADTETDASKRRPADPELRVIAAILRLLGDIPESARSRVMTYLSDRYCMKEL